MKHWIIFLLFFFSQARFDLAWIPFQMTSFQQSFTFLIGIVHNCSSFLQIHSCYYKTALIIILVSLFPTLSLPQEHQIHSFLFPSLRLHIHQCSYSITGLVAVNFHFQKSVTSLEHRHEAIIYIELAPLRCHYHSGSEEGLAR